MSESTVPTIRPRRAVRFRWWARGASLLLLIGAVVVLRRPLFLGNVGTVDPGRVYRSAQPKGNLDALIAAYEPASILNLRGGSPKDDWYAAEVAATRRDGIDFYDEPMSAERRPSRRQLLTLIDFFERAEYPILIHCKKGADRTGLACSIYLLTMRGLDPEAAEGVFTIAHGHVPLFGPERLHEPLDEYADWLAAGGLAHTPARFREWVASEYRDPTEPEPFVPLRPGSRWERVEATAGIAGSGGSG